MSRKNQARHPAKRSRFGKPTRKIDRPARSKCGLVAYRDREEALWWMGRLTGSKVRSGTEKPKEKRAFPCPHCPGKWHLTDQPAKSDPGY